MKIVVVADENTREQFSATGDTGHEITWQDTIPAPGSADCCIDLVFDQDSTHREKLEQLKDTLVIVSDCVGKDIPPHWVRINAWPTLAKGNLIEAFGQAEKKKDTEMIFSLFGKKPEWAPSGKIFITSRVISLIINEAYHALEENVSTKEDINTAMKLGTNYPYGPFEWGEKIGLRRVARLLHALAEKKPGYQPAPLLLKEAGLP